MNTHGLFSTRTQGWRILAALASLVLALPAQATFHFMQIEQVMGGVNGDTAAQAVQLRMRLAGQVEVGGSDLVVYDAAGNNPITILTFPNDVSTGTAGSRILITSASFASYEATPITADFTMTSAIPASYLAAGRLAFQNGGLIFWSVSWGGAGYTGPNTGRMENDADGNFGPPFAGALPSTSTSALRFNGAANAQSTSNAADYSVTAGAATFTNNNGDSTLVIGLGPTPTPTATATPPPATPTPTPATPTPPPATPTPSPTAPPSTFGNISTRLRVETGDNVLIGGFIITGTQSKRVIVRAIGPSLPLAGALVNPILELRDGSGVLIRSNDDWRIGGQEAEIIATTIPPVDDLESAIVADLPANNSAYTAIVRGVNNGTGIGVVEAYDLDPAVDSTLANISTRGLVQTGDNVLIAGLIVVGQNPMRVIVRAIGPSLQVPGPLGDPTLELRDGDGALVASNDDWRDDPVQESEINATGIPPTNDLESAIVLNLPPGPYTAIVRGANNMTGVALVEAYGLD